MHKCKPEDAPKIREWIETRGGILIWDSANLGNPGASWTTPATTSDGRPYGKPDWQAGKVVETITDIKDVQVVIPKEVKRFHVAVEQSRNGLQLDVTTGGSRRIRKAVAKHQDAWYEFDYSSYENCVIFVPDKTIPLAEFAAVGCSP